MADIINLRRVKRQRAREQDAQTAAENRARSGLSKAERLAQAKRRGSEDARLDAARIDAENPEP